MKASKTVEIMLNSAEREAWRTFHPPQTPSDASITGLKYFTVGVELEDRGLITAAEYAFGFAKSQAPNVLNWGGLPNARQAQVDKTWGSVFQRSEHDIVGLLNKEVRLQLPV
ncbi:MULTISPECIES: hypothetical protein [unclassified Pseudomonas]|uniref:hypothetical protein n=1 Tax=unclassified Pseudomonas TaxID=196821 RepID=UPI0035C19793